MRYIVNLITKQIHDKLNLKEECNIDQIEHKQEVDLLTIKVWLTCKYDLCDHCFGE